MKKYCLDCKKRITRQALYCKPCGYKHRPRPRGLVYILKSVNPTWFKKGQIPWNSGLAGKGICKPNSGSLKKGQRISPRTEFKKGENLGDANYKWKGDEVGYFALHTWISRKLGKAKKCATCGTSSGRIEWANKSNEYRRNINDWISLCKKHHTQYDRETWGNATKKFQLNK